MECELSLPKIMVDNGAVETEAEEEEEQKGEGMVFPDHPSSPAHVVLTVDKRVTGEINVLMNGITQILKIKIKCVHRDPNLANRIKLPQSNRVPDSLYSGINSN